jgi:hypothetical protein
MKPGAGETDDGHIGIGLVLRRGLRKPMLHVRASRGHLKRICRPIGGTMQNLRGGSPPYVCVVGGFRPGKQAAGFPRMLTKDADELRRQGTNRGGEAERDHSIKGDGEERRPGGCRGPRKRNGES